MSFLSNIFKKKTPKMKTGEILPAGEMKEKYDLTIENYRPQRLNPNNIPQQFRDLVELAAKWGIGDDIIRDDLHKKTSPDEKQVLKSALNGRTRAISEWLDTFSTGKMTQEAAAFLYMLSGLEEMGILVDPGPNLEKK